VREIHKIASQNKSPIGSLCGPDREGLPRQKGSILHPLASVRQNRGNRKLLSELESSSAKWELLILNSPKSVGRMPVQTDGKRLMNPDGNEFSEIRKTFPP